MSAGYVTLTEDSGKKVQTDESSVSGQTVEAQTIVVVSATGLTSSYMQVTEGTGKKMLTLQNIVGGNTVHALAVSPV